MAGSAGGWLPIHGLWALVFAPEGTLRKTPNMSVFPNVAISFYEPNQSVIATGMLQYDQPLHYRTQFARNLQPGDAIWFVFGPPETIPVGDVVVVNVTINFAVTY
jgi:hypothetical protein